MSRLRVSVVQSCPPQLSLSSRSPSESLSLTLSKLDALTAQVAAQNSGFAVFPEAFIGGYPKFATFGATIGDRQPEGRDDYLAYWSGAIPLPATSSLPVPPGSPVLAEYTALQQILSTSSKHGVFLVLGVIERSGGTLYCTLLAVHPEHGLVGKRRKLMPTAAERVVWGQGEPEDLDVLVTRVKGLGSEEEAEDVQVRVSKSVCWENYMPLLRTHFYSQNVQLYCAPTVDSRPAWEHSMIHIALEGRCFVLSACQFSQQSNYGPAHPVGPGQERDSEGVVIAGGSCIISPMGEVLAGPLRGREGVLTAEIDLEDCVRGKMDLDVTGHYARPDVFQLTVRTK
ncbi:carbon-nitrogen hydrolase [Dacryopinax primogenitus]|uniref:Carbon-nitrogen hydrolase n=1 Tax=Dacryopinax primogenitus (strain DJM 731) TaxID=1858805 RepID=M5FWI9_DACPD|nr:carbon-nitrogen hydrolase [Dacryopinax primogenitus]EJT97776.1 carbon-nitrogen hydrolase [Dacryopinax primogenitus]